MSHQRWALVVIAAAVVLDTALGIAFAFADHVSIGDGLYLATAIGSTSGYAQVLVRGWLPHLLVVGMFLTVIPLFSATFALFTSGLAAVHVHHLRGHLESLHAERMAQAHRHHEELKAALSKRPGTSRRAT